MTDSIALCQNLQTLWHQDFPLSKAMDMRVESFVDHVLITRTPLTPNTNTHGTAFAGSLYAIEALTAWGLLYLELQLSKLDASIIHAHGSIDFAKPVREDIVTHADFAGHEAALAELKSKGKTRLTLKSSVTAGGQIASEFSGDYMVRLNT